MDRSQLKPEPLSFWWRLRAFFTVLTVPPLILVLPLQRLTRIKTASNPGNRPSDQALAAWVDQRMHRLPWPWRHTCLRRGTVLYRLLRRGGRSVTLWIGVKRDDAGALAAHAWLTLDGSCYLENGKEIVSEFTPIAHFPESSAEAS